MRVATISLAATFLAASIASAQGPAAARSPAAPTTERQMVITFDDLPAVAQVNDGVLATHERITTRLIATITENRIPVIGFVNEAKLVTDGAPDPQRIAFLRQWTDAGLELGNHGYAHLDMHTTSLDAYLADITRGDSVTRALTRDSGQRPRYFRHPFLHTGRSLDDRRRVEALLTERGYRVAPVTIDDQDWLFAAAYDYAPDSATRVRLADEYVRYMEAITAYYEQQSTALFGREIPQVLLVHANNLNADHFGRVAEMLRRRGYRFVPMAQALDDPVYASADTFTGAGGISWIHRWAITQGERGDFFAGEPPIAPWVMTLSRQQP
nr:polysaccharide deacetylase family protein [Longimicrobium terrae]